MNDDSSEWWKARNIFLSLIPVINKRIYMIVTTYTTLYLLLEIFPPFFLSLIRFFSYQRIFSILTYLFRVSSMSSYMKLFPQQWRECHNAQRSKYLLRKRWWCFFENPNNIYRLLALNVRTWSFLYVHMPFWERNIFSVNLLALFLSFLKMSLFSTNIGFRCFTIGKFTQNLVKCTLCTHVQILNICACIAFGWWI